MNAAIADIGRLLGALVVGYLFGSVPSGVLVGKLFGDKDPRAVGSGKTGATNILRTVGPGAAVIVVCTDMAKGVIPVLLARYVIFPGQPWAEVVAGLAALLGHNYSLFIGFKGGRGVATGAGAGLAMQPVAILVAACFFSIPIAVTRYVSLGSILAAASSAVGDAVLVATGRDSYAHLTFFVIASAVVIYSHRDNITRLLHGTERKLGQKAT